mgnify:CR=1 FL=1
MQDEKKLAGRGCGDTRAQAARTTTGQAGVLAADPCFHRPGTLQAARWKHRAGNRPDSWASAPVLVNQSRPAQARLMAAQPQAPAANHLPAGASARYQGWWGRPTSSRGGHHRPLYVHKNVDTIVSSAVTKRGGCRGVSCVPEHTDTARCKKHKKTRRQPRSGRHTTLNVSASRCGVFCCGPMKAGSRRRPTTSSCMRQQCSIVPLARGPSESELAVGWG